MVRERPGAERTPSAHELGDVDEVAHLLEEEALVLGDRHAAVAPLDAHVVREIQRDLDDHAEAAVPADRPVEEVPILRGARLDHGAIGEHHFHRPDRENQRPQPDVAAVRVHRQRTANGEIGVRLHDLHGKAGGVDVLLDLAPRGPRLYRNGLRRARETEDRVVPAHVDVQGAVGRGLAAHAVARAADGDRPGMRPHRGHDLRRPGGRDHPGHGHRVDARDVVHQRRGRGALDRDAAHAPDRRAGGDREHEHQQEGESTQRGPEAGRESAADAGTPPRVRTPPAG